VNAESVKKCRYRIVKVKCCFTCEHRIINHVNRRIFCDKVFTDIGRVEEVDLLGFCKMYYPDKQEAGNGNC
jgi:hypothetical protein